MTNNIIIIDDIRYPEEAMRLEELERQGLGILIRLEGEQRGENVSPKLLTTESELALDNYDFKHRISNRGTEAETISQLEKILTEV